GMSPALFVRVLGIAPPVPAPVGVIVSGSRVLTESVHAADPRTRRATGFGGRGIPATLRKILDGLPSLLAREVRRRGRTHSRCATRDRKNTYGGEIGRAHV